MVVVPVTLRQVTMEQQGVQVILVLGFTLAVAVQAVRPVLTVLAVGLLRQILTLLQRIPLLKALSVLTIRFTVTLPGVHPP